VNFNVNNVRVAKLLGGGFHNSCVVRGIVLKNDAVGSIKTVEKAKVILEHIHSSCIFIDYLSIMFILLPTLINFLIVPMREGNINESLDTFFTRSIWQLGYSYNPCLHTLSLMIDYYLKYMVLTLYLIVSLSKEFFNIHVKVGPDCEFTLDQHYNSFFCDSKFAALFVAAAPKH
jgi:hypothetical protein